MISDKWVTCLFKVTKMISSSIKGSKALHKEIHEALVNKYGEREADSLAIILIEYFFEMGRTQILMDVPFTEFEEEIVENINECIAKLIQNEPIQHILGETEFYGLPFYVNENVLVPRQETEELVDWIIKDQKGVTQFNLLDVGTGSGCIPISIKEEYQEAKIIGLDVSLDALEVAQDNAELNQVSIDWVHDDIRAASYKPENLDIIVSNPPYITNKEKKEMDSNVLDYDPHLALFVEDNNPLEFYNAIADFASSILKKEVNSILKSMSILEKKLWSY